MASAIFGPRGITVARDLLKAEAEGLDLIQGGFLRNNKLDEHTLVWEDYGFGLKTTNSMATENAMIFQYPVNYTIKDIILTDSNTKTKALTLVLQKGTIQSDTIKFLREIVITLDEQA